MDLDDYWIWSVFGMVMAIPLGALAVGFVASIVGEALFDDDDPFGKPTDAGHFTIAAVALWTEHPQGTTLGQIPFDERFLVIPVAQVGMPAGWTCS